MTRLRVNFVGGLIEDNPLTTLATTLTSAALSALPVVAAPDYVPITLDSDGIAGAPEIAYITAHAAGATTATISRGAEGTTARQHAQDIRWVHGPTVEDHLLLTDEATLTDETTTTTAAEQWGTETATFAQADCPDHCRVEATLDGAMQRNTTGNCAGNAVLQVSFDGGSTWANMTPDVKGRIHFGSATGTATEEMSFSIARKAEGDPTGDIQVRALAQSEGAAAQPIFIRGVISARVRAA